MNSIFPFLSFICRQTPTRVFMFVALIFGLVACGNPRPTVKPVAQNTTPVQNFENDLTFNDVTLEQADQQGRPFWKMKAKQATYSKDKKVALVESPNGELFQDGKPVYHIQGQQGEIQQDGKQLFLKGQVVATDPRNNLVLRGNELEWRPREDLLIVRNSLTGTNPQVRAVAQEARVKSRASRIELLGGVAAVANDPPLQMRTEHLIWQIREQKLIGDRPVQIDRYQGKAITDTARGNSGDVDLQTKIVTLKQNAQLTLLEPPLQVDSNELTWNLNTETVTSDQPLRIVHRREQMTVTANKGRMDLRQKIAYLTGNVYGIGQRGQSLKAKALNWYLSSQLFKAEGDVVYRQVEPKVSFTGQKAVGKLQDQSIVVSGGRVVTKIIPSSVK